MITRIHEKSIRSNVWKNPESVGFLSKDLYAFYCVLQDNVSAKFLTLGCYAKNIESNLGTSSQGKEKQTLMLKTASQPA